MAGQFKSSLKQFTPKFPKYLPAFDKVFSEEKMIYVFLPLSDFMKNEIWVMTKTGEIKKKITVKKAQCYWIKKGLYYYILETEEEEWELFSQKII